MGHFVEVLEGVRANVGGMALESGYVGSSERGYRSEVNRVEFDQVG